MIAMVSFGSVDNLNRRMKRGFLMEEPRKSLKQKLKVTLDRKGYSWK